MIKEKEHLYIVDVPIFCSCEEKNIRCPQMTKALICCYDCGCDSECSVICDVCVNGDICEFQYE